MNSRIPSENRIRPMPLDAETFADFDGVPIPEIRWIVPGVLVEGGVTLFSGQGGKGKSLLCMQLQAACALGMPWLGIDIPEPVTTFALYCEDERVVLHKRMEDIRKHYGCDFRNLEDARFKARVGMSNELMIFWGRKESGELTPLYRQLAEQVAQYCVRVLIIDTVADTFGGNENFRAQARAFVNALRALVLPYRGGVIVNAHPSRAGLADGSGQSGSTGWEASVRTRINLTEPKKADEDGEGEQAPTKERVLKVMKNNYGPSGTKWKLEWREGVFVRTDLYAAGLSIVDRLDAKRKLLEAAVYLVKNGHELSSAADAPTSLIKKARALRPECKDMAFTVLMQAQDQLIAQKELVLLDVGPNSRRRKLIRPSHLRYASETGEAAPLNLEGEPK